MIGRLLAFCTGPLDEERRASLSIQVASRWVLAATALLIVVIAPGTFMPIRGVLEALILVGAAGNAFLHLRLRSPRPLLAWHPAVVSLLDVFAITGAVWASGQFDNPNFVFYYPSFVAFTLVFPGVTSWVYALGTLGTYALVALPSASFDTADPTDVKELVVRLATAVTVVAITNLAVRIERARRIRAVEQALAAHLEHQRIVQEIHDGIAQEIYMLAVNLEANTKRIEDDPPLRERMETLTNLARRALLETRSLLFNLEPALSGDEGIVPLLTGQAAEFSAVTRIPIRVAAGPAAPRLDPRATVEVYRIVQEALANIYRHSGATGGEIAVTTDAGMLVVRVTDNGHGFDAAAPTRRGLGLGGMRDRAARIGGEFRIDSEIDGGTTIELRVPAALESTGRDI